MIPSLSNAIYDVETSYEMVTMFYRLQIRDDVTVRIDGNEIVDENSLI